MNCGGNDLLVDLSHFTANLVLFINGKHVGDFPCVQEISDVFQEILLLDLGVWRHGGMRNGGM